MLTIYGYKKTKSSIKLNKEFTRKESDIRNFIGKNVNNILVNKAKISINFGVDSKKDKSQKKQNSISNNHIMLYPSRPFSVTLQRVF